MLRRRIIVVFMLLLGLHSTAFGYTARFKIFAKDVHTLLFHVYASQTQKSHLDAAKELFNKISVRLKPADKDLINQKLNLLTEKLTSENVMDFANTVIRIYELPTSPIGRPDYAQGKETYSKNCASCHAAAGDGKGPLAWKLSLKPSSFKDPNASVFRCYNRNFVGDPMSGKIDIYQVVGEANLWSACFYALTLPYGGRPNSGVSAPLTLNKLTMGTAAQYDAWAKEFKTDAAQLRYLPYNNQIPRR